LLGFAKFVRKFIKRQREIPLAFLCEHNKERVIFMNAGLSNFTFFLSMDISSFGQNGETGEKNKIDIIITLGE